MPHVVTDHRTSDKKCRTIESDKFGTVAYAYKYRLGGLEVLGDGMTWQGRFFCKTLTEAKDKLKNILDSRE